MDTPNYYAVIPAFVRYDRTLTPFAKILYAEITALASKTGICWASNRYFADLYVTTRETISRTVGRLEAKGYVKVKMIKDDDGLFVRREISIIHPTQLSTPNDILVNTPVDKKVKKNSTSNNNKIEYIQRDVEDFELFWSKLNGRKKNKSDALKEYMKIETKMNAEDIANCFNKLLRVRDEKYVPYPHRWLRNEGWNEKVEEDVVNTHVYVSDDEIYRDREGYIISKKEYEELQKK